MWKWLLYLLRFEFALLVYKIRIKHFINDGHVPVKWSHLLEQCHFGMWLFTSFQWLKTTQGKDCCSLIFSFISWCREEKLCISQLPFLHLLPLCCLLWFGGMHLALREKGWGTEWLGFGHGPNTFWYWEKRPKGDDREKGKWHCLWLAFIWVTDFWNIKILFKI